MLLHRIETSVLLGNDIRFLEQFSAHQPAKDGYAARSAFPVVPRKW